MPSVPKPPSPEWRTHCESTNYRETPRYDETVGFAKRLAAATPLLEFKSFGKSGQGRELPLMIAAAGETFTPEAARKSGKAIVLIQACIHAGEPDGKDAGLALLREICVTRTLPGLLENVVLLFIPIYNADGHERVSPFNRINQNGPNEMGWRTTMSYQNLNRDYMKADTPETRSWLALWNEWDPDLFIDCHVTDGADYRYNITYQFEHHDGIDEDVLAWERLVIDGKVVPRVEAAGHLVSWYLEFIDNRDLTMGIRDFNGSPRFSTGYVPLRNRPAILIETHMLKDYRSRVMGTYEFLRCTLEEVNRDSASLLRAVRSASEKTVKGSASASRFPLDYELTKKAVPYQLKAVEYKTELSEISGSQRVVFGSEPLDLTVPLFNAFRVSVAIAPPRYYIIPPQWQNVIEVLSLHGLRFRRLSAPIDLEVESYRFSEVRWPVAPFEGRHMPRFHVELVRETRSFPAGSVIVSMLQEGAKVAINLLEPQAPDSLVAWGFFNAIFEQKERGESYVLEQLSRQMLDEHSELQPEFEMRLATDPGFAASPADRLEFFHMRSPYWDNQMNLYPIGRINDQLDSVLNNSSASTN